MPTGTEEKGREVEDRGMGKGIFGVCKAETESLAKKRELSTSSCNQLVVVAQNATTETMGDAKGNGGDKIWDITCKLHVANFLCPRLAVEFWESFLEDSLDLYNKKCQSDKFRGLPDVVVPTKQTNILPTDTNLLQAVILFVNMVFKIFYNPSLPSSASALLMHLFIILLPTLSFIFMVVMK